MCGRYDLTELPIERLIIVTDAVQVLSETCAH